MTPVATHVPNALKVLLAIGVLLAVNQLAPGIPQAVLVLVALYLLLLHSAEIGQVLNGAVNGLDATLRGRPLGGAR